MRKKVLLVIALAAFAVGGVFAQEWNNYSPAVAHNRLFVNAGIGIGPTGGWSMGVPPISASVDFKLSTPAPITLGAVAMFTTWKRSDNMYYYTADITYTNTGFGVRGMYHFNFLETIDTYAGLTLGYVIQGFDVKASSGYTGIAGGYAGSNFFLFGGNIGARYFFTDLMGAYVEIGFSGLQFISAGITLKK